MTDAKNEAACGASHSDAGLDTDYEQMKEIERELFELDAMQYGFDLTRLECAAPELSSEYLNDATGHRWAGWLARSCG